MGFVFAEDAGYTGVDLDKCVNPENGEIDAWASGVIDLLDRYTEISPSGTGVKIWVKASMPDGGRKTKAGNGAIEAYGCGRYFTATGRHDAGNADRFRALFGDDILYSTAERQWLVWDGTRWVYDRGGRVYRLAKKAMAECLRQVVEAGESDLADLKGARFNDDLAHVLAAHRAQFVDAFGEPQPTHYLFAWGLHCSQTLRARYRISSTAGARCGRRPVPPAGCMIFGTRSPQGSPRTVCPNRRCWRSWVT